jgi:hypothetical protein
MQFLKHIRNLQTRPEAAGRAHVLDGRSITSHKTVTLTFSTVNDVNVFQNYVILTHV